jgi:hypothetical protein
MIGENTLTSEEVSYSTFEETHFSPPTASHILLNRGEYDQIWD